MKKKAKVDIIKEQFPNKQINRLVSTRGECPLTIHQRLVLSAMLFRCRHQGKQRAASISRIAHLSGLTRKTVAAALKVLESCKLAKRVKSGRWAFRDDGFQNCDFWFSWRRGGREISHLNYHYHLLPKPKSPLSVIDCLIHLTDTMQPELPVNLLAARFQLSRNTIRAARKRLSALTISPDFFAAIEFQPTPPRPTAKSEFVQGVQGGFEKNIAAKLLEFGIPQEKITQLFQRARSRYLGENLDEFYMSLLSPNSQLSLDAIWRSKPDNFRGDGFNWITIRAGV